MCRDFCECELYIGLRSSKFKLFLTLAEGFIGEVFKGVVVVLAFSPIFGREGDLNGALPPPCLSLSTSDFTIFKYNEVYQQLSGFLTS